MDYINHFTRKLCCMTSEHADQEAGRLRPEAVWRGLRELGSAADVVAAEHAFMRDVGLSGGPIRALRALLEAGSQSMRGLADQLGCDKSYVTGLVKPLLSGGLVTLEPNPSDGRVKIAALTESGHSTAKRAARVYERPPAAFAALSDDDLEELAALLAKLQSGPAQEESR